MITRVRVGALDYAVVEVPELHKTKSKQIADGHHDYSNVQMRIRAELSEQVKRITLWHEIIHSGLAQANLDAPENVVDVLAHVIVQVLRDDAELRGNEETETAGQVQGMGG